MIQFFEQVSADSGLAYVVILHLSPDYDSQLAHILQAVTPIPVMQVTKTVRVEANHVYVVPPDKQLHMDDGTIVVRSNARLEERRAPVDMFLRTLAESHGSLAIAVILSGTGANGSMGLKRVKEKGGAVFVQNPREALYNEMPRHAIATNLVDDILPVDQIPARLLTYRQGLGTVSIPEETLQRPEDQQQALREVFTQLRMRTGHDFSNYKRSTLLRRLERRISIQNLASLPAYAAFLREHPDETQALLKDLLISVTNFFRDGLAFHYLEQQVMPALTRRGKETLRIWVAGCATGEEAYSLAMLCAEQTMGGIDMPKVQLFATDIDEDAIATAREGLYTLNDAADVSAERLSRFFTKEGDEYRVRREIREMILFANQNVLKDPPFSKLDLVTCRNLLIYLNPVAQERVMETFHFALNPGGYLLLGLSETVDGSGDLYATVSREHHLYQSRQVANRPYPVPESIPQLPQLRKRSSEADLDPESRPAARLNFGDLHQQVLEQYAPPSIIVNGDYDILHFTPRAGRYLHFAGGELSKNLLKLIRPELRLELRTALYQATQQQSNVEVRNLRINLNESTETLILHIRPVLGEGNPAHGFILVLLEPVHEGADHATPVLTPVEPLARQLEDELIRVKAQLRSANEHHELQAEELKASNEELQAMNEELRSAAEELETSKEELQSINEELTTVNQELKVKVEETSLVGNNLQNLINSTDIATLFLDRSLRVILFTPATRQIFNLIPTDFGRPLTDITNRLDYHQLQTDAEAVLSKLQPIEREVATTDGRAFIMRILPYRTAEDRINGVVLTFVEITDRKAAEAALRRSEENYRTQLEQEVQDRTQELNTSRNLLQATMDASLDMIQVFKAVRNEQGELVDFTWVLNNQAAETIYGDVIGQHLLQRQPGVEKEGIFETFKQVVETGIADQRERHYVHEQFNGWFYQSVVKLDDGVATTTVDITSRKKAEQEVQQSKSQLQAIIDAPNIGIAVYKAIRDKKGDVIDFVHESINRASVAMLGEDYTGKRLSDHGENGTSQLPQFIDVIQTGTSNGYVREADFRGRQVWFAITNTPLDGDRLVHTWEDVTEQKQAQHQLQETAENLQAVLDSSPASIALLKAVHDPQHPALILDFRLAVGNNKLAQFFGQPLSALLGQSAKQGHFRELLWDGETLDILRHVYFSNESRYEEKSMPSPNQDRWLALSVMRQDDGVMLTGLDITELKQIQVQQSYWLNELEASRQSVDALTGLRASLNQRTELLRSVSHDLRGNFGVINGALSLLEMTDSGAERAQIMDMVLRNVNQATGLLTDLLDLARLETGQQERQVDSFDASVLFHELGQSLQLMAHEQLLTLAVSGPDMLVVETDRQLVYRMAQNLIINALKYTHQGGVTVQWGEAGDEWWFAVVDTGPGLAQQLVDRLNSTEPGPSIPDLDKPTYLPASSPPADESVAEVNQTKSAMPGSGMYLLRGEGIGLRIVRELAQLLNARLAVSSEAGKGTYFIVNLPLRYADMSTDT